jgi:hypothetical protein
MSTFRFFRTQLANSEDVELWTEEADPDATLPVVFQLDQGKSL